MEYEPSPSTSPKSKSATVFRTTTISAPFNPPTAILAGLSDKVDDAALSAPGRNSANNVVSPFEARRESRSPDGIEPILSRGTK